MRLSCIIDRLSEFGLRGGFWPILLKKSYSLSKGDRLHQ